jgi:hypothetical protein
MNRIILLACFGLFIIPSLFGQEIDFKYKTDSTILNNGNIKYTISINIIKGEGPFSVGIYEDRYKDGLVALDTKENVITNSVKLEFIGRKHCLIFVRSKIKSAIKPLNY